MAVKEIHDIEDRQSLRFPGASQAKPLRHPGRARGPGIAATVPAHDPAPLVLEAGLGRIWAVAAANCAGLARVMSPASRGTYTASLETSRNGRNPRRWDPVQYVGRAGHPGIGRTESPAADRGGDQGDLVWPGPQDREVSAPGCRSLESRRH
jgi:hypothetical protein